MLCVNYNETDLGGLFSFEIQKVLNYFVLNGKLNAQRTNYFDLMTKLLDKSNLKDVQRP